MSTFVINMKANTEGKLNPREVYDLLMAQIEPDLVTASIPGLKAKYKDEKPAERKARGKRYKEAFAKYEKLLGQLVGGIKQHAASSRKQALASTEAKEREAELAKLQQMESLFQS